jgi:hypothetical protein
VSAPISAGGESCLTVNFYFAVRQTACFSSISAICSMVIGWPS